MKLALKIVGSLVLIAIIGIISISSFNYTYRNYNRLVSEGINHIEDTEIEYIKESDIEHLPELIQSYLNYVGVVGTEKVLSFEAVFYGEMKMNKDSEFSSYNAKQTSFINQGTRLFYMDLYMSALKISGLHHFDDEDARMKIKILDVFTVVDEKGEDMQKAETVTFFNDMVLFAPQTLISDKISWEVLDDERVNATFTNNGITISATLFFDEDGRIVNFISNDRLALDKDGLESSIPWSTPIEEYQEINGLNLPKYGTAVWHYDEADFTYISLNIKEINYNIHANKTSSPS